MSDDRVRSENEILKTHLKELVKQYTVFDGQGRPSKIYTASRRASPGDVCLVTEYIYSGPVTTVIKARKEAEGQWDASSDGWDDDFTI